MRKIVATAALPYANGPIHIGHLVEYLQTDFWTRFQKMRGHECLYICADDTHGTPIMVSARKEGITPEELIAKKQKEHELDFKDFQIEFDHYSSTNSEENRILAEKIFLELEKNNHTHVKKIEQLYCKNDQMFLPDRFVKGTCPKCKSEEQYGDSCDNCGATYSPTDLISAACAICGTQPTTKDSDHIFVRLSNFDSFLKDWVPKHTQKEVNNKLQEWLNDGLRDWDISRDAPYFGFEIPGHPGKYFYVWLDAPVGYISSTWQWCKKNNKNLDDYWKNSSSEIYHFIGKDIVYFHTLFWPSMLKNANFNTPNHVFVHGFLTVNGEKMSKSKGTFIGARTYLNHLDPTYLRYYFACKLASGLDDIDLNLEDFSQRVNSDLVGKITNLGSRGAQMLNKRIDGQMGEFEEDGLKVVQFAQAKSDEIAKLFENREFNKGLTLIREIADAANKYFDEKEPWKLIKEDKEQTRRILTAILNVFRILSVYLKPILPDYTKKVESLLNEKDYDWSDSKKVLINHKISNYEHLATRVDPKKVEAMVEESKQQDSKNENSQSQDAYISYDDFMKVDLRVGRIVEASSIPEADKLVKLQVDIGEDKPRQIFAGIKAAYTADDLKDQMVVVVANLKPRKMKFGLSEGMVIAAGPGGKDIFLVHPSVGAKTGMQVK